MVWSKPLVAVVLAGSLLVSACSSAPDVDGGDGAPAALPEPAAGPVPDLPVSAASIASPLPDIAVRQLNGDGGWVQFRNELPAEQPVLIWFWAPF